MSSRRQRAALVAALLAASAAASPAVAQETPPTAPPGTVPAAGPPAATPPPATAPPSRPAPPRARPVARHPALATGWARPRSAGLELRTRPDPALAPSATVAPRLIAGRVIGIRSGVDGAVWLRLTLPDRRGGWARGTELRRAPAPATLSPAAVRAIGAARAGLGPRHSVIVRDALGSTLLDRGTRRPLVLASVTKLATMAAALERFPVDRRTAAAVLGSSDNGRAQSLSDRLGGGGGAAAGARATVGAVAELGADMRLVDGSGLLPGNVARGDEVADLLLAARDRPWFTGYLRALPLAGRTGTLGGRMTDGPARARVRAKTGTLFVPAVSTLAGYAWPAGAGLRPDRALVVVILANGRHHLAARPHQDAIMQAVTARGALVPPEAPRR